MSFEVEMLQSTACDKSRHLTSRILHFLRPTIVKSNCLRISTGCHYPTGALAKRSFNGAIHAMQKEESFSIRINLGKQSGTEQDTRYRCGNPTRTVPIFSSQWQC